MKLEELLQIENLNGKVIAFPTDTVYGVGCLINDEESLKRIYSLKDRDYNKPLAILVGTLEQATSLVRDLSKNVVEIIKKHWPGALTIICKKSDEVPTFLNPRFLTIGIRMPKSDTALAILKKFGPMAVTSVNISGEAPLNSYVDIKQVFGNKIDYIVESDEISSNVSSTVIEIDNDYIRVLREGDIKIK